MKIIILNGSPRKNGATANILHEMEKKLLDKGCSIEFINISELKVSPCVGCCNCYKTGICHIKDDAESLSTRMGNADGIIIGSPTYASNVSGQLKQFIDRGHFVIEQLLHGKYAVSVATGENYGNNDTSKAIVKLIKFSGAKLSGKIICTIPFNANLQEDKKQTKKIHVMADKLYSDIQQRKFYFSQTIMHKVIFNIGIKPFVLRKGEKYDGVISRWKSINII